MRNERTQNLELPAAAHKNAVSVSVPVLQPNGESELRPGPPVASPETGAGAEAAAATSMEPEPSLPEPELQQWPELPRLVVRDDDDDDDDDEDSLVLSPTNSATACQIMKSRNVRYAHASA